MFIESNEQRRKKKKRKKPNNNNNESSDNNEKIEAKKRAHTFGKRKREETCGKLFTMALVIQIMK